jgi:conjugal transfer pilus assembly protein TraA
MIIAMKKNVSLSSQQWMMLGFVFALLCLIPIAAMAGTGGTEFDDIWDTLVDWSQGTLGRIIAGSMILVGIIAGVVRQSLMAFAVGIGGAIGLYNFGTVIEAVMSATLPVVSTVPALLPPAGL